jgi:hypothetical protein
MTSSQDPFDPLKRANAPIGLRSGPEGVRSGLVDHRRQGNVPPVTGLVFSTPRQVVRPRSAAGLP